MPQTVYSNKLNEAECCCILDAYVHGCIHTLKTVMGQCIPYRMRLFPLTDIHLTMNWQNGRTALMSAAQNGHSNVVETLLQHGACVDVQSVVSALYECAIDISLID